MAKFNSSGLSSVETATYVINSFDGVDYTDMPSKVDASRAVDISNYLPKGNSLVKRKGWKQYNPQNYSELTYEILNIWPFNNEYVTFCKYKKDNTYHLFVHGDLEFDNYGKPTNIEFTYNFETVSTQNINKKGVAWEYEGKLFILVYNQYLVAYIGDADWIIEKAEDIAYSPVVITNLDVENSNTVPSKLEDFNLLSKTISINLVSKSSDFANVVSKNFNANNSSIYSYDLRSICNILSLLEDDIYQILSNLNSHRKGEETIYVNEQQSITIGDHNLTFDKSFELNGIFYGIFPNEQTIAILNADFNNIGNDSNYKIYAIYKHMAGESNLIKITDYETIMLPYQPKLDSQNVINCMQFGTIYGSYGYKDRLFLSGNPSMQNTDIHSSEAIYGERWQDFTYFSDLDYQTFGSNGAAITGYGYLNNGYMAIFKELKANQPNLYFRRSEMYQIATDVNGNPVYKERFPIVVSGISLDNKKDCLIINYGNDLLINTEKGVYKVNATPSTATQTYEANEISYMIRGDLSDDLTDSCFAIHNGYLFLSRKDKNGNLRTYVANENRYSFVNGKQQYEWWCLDNINAKSFHNIDNKLFFINDHGLCEFTDNYEDQYKILIENIHVNNHNVSSDVYLISGKFYLSENHRFIKDIINTENVGKSYNDFKNNVEISFDKSFVDLINLKSYTKSNGNKSGEYIFNICFFGKYNKYVDLLKDLSINGRKGCYLLFDGYAYFMYNTEEIVHDNYIELIIYGKETSIEPINEFKSKIPHLYFTNDYKFKVNEFYRQIDGHLQSLSDYLENSEVLNFNSDLFNIFDVKAQNIPLHNISDIDFICDVSFEFKKPVESYWYGKHESFDRLNYLKTTTGFNFTTESTEKTTTKVGYRTDKREINYDAVVRNSILDFNEIDFTNFSFSTYAFTKTYSSKKKIKNFSFLQLIFKSDISQNSTIGAISVNYKLTKSNKGVK